MCYACFFSMEGEEKKGRQGRQEVCVCVNVRARVCVCVSVLERGGQLSLD